MLHKTRRRCALEHVVTSFTEPAIQLNLRQDLSPKNCGQCYKPGLGIELHFLWYQNLKIFVLMPEPGQKYLIIPFSKQKYT